MNKKELRNINYLKWVNPKAFPKESDPDFLIRVHQNWHNLEKEKIDKKNSGAYFLYFYLGRKKNKFYVFIYWLTLCLERPWKENRKYSPSEKRWENILDKVDNILSKLSENFPDDPEPQTLRKYKRTKNFEEIIASASLGPELIELRKLIKKISSLKIRDFLEESPILKIQESQKELSMRISVFKKLFKRHPSIKFIDIIKSQKFITKRDLMRKLGIDKEQCEFLLREAEEENFIKLRQFPKNRVFIIYQQKY